MFERYTEIARRVIFHARFEAGEFGSPFIETEHLLLGLLREDKVLTIRVQESVESIRKDIEIHTTIREKLPTSVEVPLSMESKRVLDYAEVEAKRLFSRTIGTEHLLLGLLQEKECFAAALLRQRGLRLDVIREELERRRQDETVRRLQGRAQRAQRAQPRGMGAFVSVPSSDFTLVFAPDLTADQIKSTLHALADYYRACGGVGFQIDFELEDVLVGEPVSV